MLKRWPHYEVDGVEGRGERQAHERADDGYGGLDAGAGGLSCNLGNAAKK